MATASRVSFRASDSERLAIGSSADIHRCVSENPLGREAGVPDRIVVRLGKEALDRSLPSGERDLLVVQIRPIDSNAVRIERGVVRK